MSYAPGIASQQASLAEVLDRRVFERPRKVLLDDEITTAIIEARRISKTPDAAATDTARAADPAAAADGQPAVTAATDPARIATGHRVDVRV
jgi:hypothetical protein